MLKRVSHLIGEMTKVVIQQNYVNFDKIKHQTGASFVSLSINDVKDNVNIINSESYWLNKEK